MNWLVYEVTPIAANDMIVLKYLQDQTEKLEIFYNFLFRFF
jgi:hypothetical protein